MRDCSIQSNRRSRNGCLKPFHPWFLFCFGETKQFHPRTIPSSFPSSPNRPSPHSLFSVGDERLQTTIPSLSFLPSQQSHLVGFQPDNPREEGKAMEAGRCAEHHAVGTTSTLSRGVEALWLDGSRRGSAAVVQQPRGTRGARLACRATGDVCLFVGSDWWRHRRKRKQSGVLGVTSQGHSGRSFFHLLSSLLHLSSLHLHF